MSTHTVSAAQADRAIQALHNATWFALCEGDRYTAMGRKAVANSFYNLLPMLAEIRKAIVEAPSAQDDAAPDAVARLHLVTTAAIEAPADDASPDPE